MKRSILLIAVVATSVMSIRPSPAMAGTLRVCPSGCTYSSIQTAINAAHTGDLIFIAPGTYTENLLIAGPVAAKTLSLLGTAGRTIIDGDQQDCVLTVETDYTVTIAGMTFTNGKCITGPGIFNDGTLTLSHVTVSHNEGIGSACGGIANDIDGTLTMISSTVNDNTTTNPLSGQGGGLVNYGTASLTDTIVSGNSAAVLGGGIENRGPLLITHSLITNNTTPGPGGGIENRRNHDTGSGPATVTLIDSLVSNNTAFTGGGLLNTEGTMTLTGSPVRNNGAAREGGGVENSFAGTTTLTSSPVSGNTAGTDGAGVANDRGTLTLNASPVIGNQATSTNSGNKGGGVAVFGGTVKLNGSRVSQNIASGPIGGLGGGIVITDGGSLTLSKSPVTNNSASTDGGGIYVFMGSVSLQISPVQHNAPDNCVNVPGC